MTDQGWTVERRWHRCVNGCSLSVREKDGEWQWSVNRYPDIHAKGAEKKMGEAMDAAKNAAEAAPKRAA